MFKKPSPEELLPWYVNRTLAEDEARAVETWLETAPQAAQKLQEYRALQRAMNKQPVTPVPERIHYRVMDRIQAAPQPGWLPAGSAWAFASGLALTVFLILWVLVQPGVELTWAAGAGDIASFRVYRALSQSDRYIFLEEIPADAGQRIYRYTDTALLLGAAYDYRIEVVERGGQSAVSQVVSGSGYLALPGMLSVVFTSALSGAACAWLLQNGAGALRLSRPKTRPA
jgi:hypothetical protein